MPRLDALAVGDAILDTVTPPLVPGEGDRQSRVRKFAYLPGGNATNFALASAALGGRVGLVASMGRDWAADILRRAYRAAGIRTRLRFSPLPTGATVAMTYSDGTRHLVTALGANADLRFADVPRSWIASAGHVHRAGYWWATRLIGAPTVRLLRRARRAGATTSLDVSTDPEGWPEARRASVLSALPHADVFFGNEEEVRGLGGHASLDASSDRLLREGAREVVVHQGDRGATVYTRTAVESADAFAVDPVNPTGCGDVFNAAYVAAVQDGAGLRDRLRFANAAAAWHLGDVRRPYPTRRQLRGTFRVAPRHRS